MRTLPAQRNLFEPTPSCSDLPCSDLPFPHRLKAIELLKALLTEAMVEPAIKIDAPIKKGAGDDQDYT
jgi:hypothetical protein